MREKNVPYELHLGQKQGEIVESRLKRREISTVGLRIKFHKCSLHNLHITNAGQAKSGQKSQQQKCNLNSV